MAVDRFYVINDNLQNTHAMHLENVLNFKRPVGFLFLSVMERNVFIMCLVRYKDVLARNILLQIAL